MSTTRKVTDTNVTSGPLSRSERHVLSLLCVKFEKRSRGNFDSVVWNYFGELAYLNCRPNASEIDDVLLFSRNHAADFELLLPAARYYLSLSASSVPVEAMFSITGLILNSKRATLSSAN